MSGVTDVAQLVLRSEIDGDRRYLLARRTMDEHWEFVGGKRERGESVAEAAKRELDEELHSVDPEHAEILAIADSYDSSFGAEYQLHPVLVELPSDTAEAIDETDLSEEHDRLDWISLSEFDDYDTLGQYPAIERLSLDS